MENEALMDKHKEEDEWMDDLLFCVLFQSYQDDGRMKNERLCAMELCVQLRRFRLEQGSNPGQLDQ